MRKSPAASAAGRCSTSHDRGGGAIGDGSGGLALDNRSSGIIDANLSGHLVIDTGNKVTNAGTLEATAGGTLEIHDNVTNTGGTIAASDPNSIVELFGATIIGGTSGRAAAASSRRRAAPARCPA